MTREPIDFFICRACFAAKKWLNFRKVLNEAWGGGGLRRILKNMKCLKLDKGGVNSNQCVFVLFIWTTWQVLRISPPDFSPPYISPPQIFTTESFFHKIWVSQRKLFITETFYHQTFIIGKMYFIEFLIRICFADFHFENLSNISKINYKCEKLI